MIRYLYKKGEHEVVGAYFSNKRMAEYEEHPEGYEEILRESRMEGNIGRVKLTTLLEDHPGRHGWKQFLLRAGMSMLSLAFAALIRVQNGVFEHLTNLTYVTNLPTDVCGIPVFYHITIFINTSKLIAISSSSIQGKAP
jgi:hypothetical protein